MEIPFPLLPRKRVQWMGSGGLTQSSGVSVQQPLVEAKAHTVIVLSHDCEFSEGKRSHFLIARVDGIAGKTTPEELELLRSGNDVEAAVRDGAAIALDTFLLDPRPGLFVTHQRANFAAITSIPMEFSSDAVAQKRAELTHETRVLFRRKVGVFFG
ncbi:MAG: hypothetical protein M3P18_22695, partial [Actinomycetota bacterium]|nr:hypothetical protein [Actinomycetota bacterium]